MSHRAPSRKQNGNFILTAKVVKPAVNIKKHNKYTKGLYMEASVNQ